MRYDGSGGGGGFFNLKQRMHPPKSVLVSLIFKPFINFATILSLNTPIVDSIHFVALLSSFYTLWQKYACIYGAIFYNDKMHGGTSDNYSVCQGILH